MEFEGEIKFGFDSRKKRARVFYSIKKGHLGCSQAKDCDIYIAGVSKWFMLAMVRHSGGQHRSIG